MTAISRKNTLITSSAITASTLATVAGAGSGVALAGVGYMHKTGTIDRIVFQKTGSGTGGVLEGRCEVISTSSQPTGTLISAGATGNVTVTGGANTRQIITLGTPITVDASNIGNPIAIIGYLSTFAASLTIARGVAGLGITGNGTLACPGNRAHTAYTIGGSGWGAGTASLLTLATALYTDDDPVLGTYALNGAITNTLVPTSGANSYLGNKFQVGTRQYLESVTDPTRMDGSVVYELYDESNNLLASSTTIPAGRYAAAALFNETFFTTRPILEANTWYRVVKRSLSGASNALLVIPSFSQALQEHVLGLYCLTSSTNGTTWTDTPGSYASLAINTSDAPSLSTSLSSPFLSKVIR